jgi:mono/diheme cytochrome c family protein
MKQMIYHKCPRKKRSTCLLCTLCAFVVSFLTAGCQQKMASQPNYRPLRPSDFFSDGRSARPLVSGTVPHDDANEDPRLLAARDLQSGEYVQAFPFAPSAHDLGRGRERYTIFCAVCHDAVGTGHGKIVERGYTPPPSYHTGYSRGLALRGQKVLLRDAPVGYFFEVVSNGYGAMPDHAAQIKPADRWRIIAYIRALQYSQHAPLEDLSEEERQTVEGK